MNNKKSLKFLNGLLRVILFVILMLFIAMFYLRLEKGELMNNLLATFVGLIVLVAYFMTVYTLKKIVDSIRARDPFVLDNVTNFKRIGTYILIIGIIEAIVNYPVPTNFVLLGTKYGSVKPIFFLYLILSIMSFVLGDVFRMAMEIKDENDLTV